MASTALGTKPYTCGLTDLGTGSYAWLQPDGGWGWSNAGLICDGDESLLVDTLFDTRLTEDMLRAMRDAEPAAAGNIGTVVNTHSNGDHCNGNSCVPKATIIASNAAIAEMAHESPAMMAGLIEQAPNMGELGEFFLHCFGSFDFAGVDRRMPDVGFDGKMDMTVGDKAVQLRQTAPAHTAGDVLVYVPEDRTVFTGDILFIEGHPIIWAGPVANWIAACDEMLAMDIETVVPGHGPITDKRGVRAVREYLVYIDSQARPRFDAGMTPLEAALDIDFSDYDSWGDGERIAVNVSTLFKHYAGDDSPNDVTKLFGLMAEVHKRGSRGKR